MLARLVEAPVSRRALAYGIDLAVIVLPLAAGFWILGSGDPRLSWAGGVSGWSALAVTASAYAAFVVAGMVRFGQSPGKRVLGLRVVAADTGQPEGAAPTLLRGIVFLCGLLCFGVLPVLAAVQFRRGVPGARLWHHQMAGTRLIDVVRGPDPMNPAIPRYPRFPELWVETGQESLVTSFPPPAPKWSAAYRAPEPARQPVRPDTVGPGVTDHGRDHGRDRLPRWAGPALRAAAVSALLALVLGGSAWGLGSLQPHNAGGTAAVDEGVRLFV